MNEALIKKLVQVKLDVAEEILEHLPSKQAEEVRDLGKIVLESLNDYANSSEKKDQKGRSSKKKDEMCKVLIE